MKVPGYAGICVACFEPVKEGELFRFREGGRNFHKDCAKEMPDSHYVKLETKLKGEALSAFAKAMQGDRVQLAWTVGEIYEAIMTQWELGTLDIQGVDELAKDLDRKGGEIGRQVSCKLKNSISVECRNKELCPKCFSRLEPAGIVRECLGCFGDARVYQDVASKMECVNCDYEEAI